MIFHLPRTIIGFVQGGRSMKWIHQLMLASKTKMFLSGILGLALVLVTSVLVVEATKYEVTVVENGEEQVINTHKGTVEELFRELGIEIGAYDYLSHQEDAPIESGMTIDYKTAKKITVTIDGTSEDYYTTEDTILAFFNEHNLSFSDHDDVSHDVDEVVEDGLEININQAFDVKIDDGGETLTVKATGGTVQDLLRQHDIILNEEDKLNLEPDDTVKEEAKIEIIRVTTETVKEEETLRYETEKKEDETLLKGKENVVTQGEDGKRMKTYEITKENGEEVSRELVEETVTKEPTNRVIAVGTKEPVQPKQTKSDSDNEANLVTLSSSSKEKESNGKTLTMTASAFSASCSGCSGVTAAGINLNANPNMKVIAVDPNVIPLGSRVWVEGYGEAVAGDTGGAIRGNRIDVHVPNPEEAYGWGVRTVQVKILD